MLVQPAMYIASMNMHKRNTVSHTLLNSNNKAHFIFIQEPWFDRIGTARKDNARQGVDMLGGVAAPAWGIHYLGFAEGQRPKVMTYVCKPTTHVSWNAHFYLFLPIFCILHNQVTTPSLHVMARKYSHVMVCHMSDCVVLVDQACDESRG